MGEWSTLVCTASKRAPPPLKCPRGAFRTMWHSGLRCTFRTTWRLVLRGASRYVADETHSSGLCARLSLTGYDEAYMYGERSTTNPPNARTRRLGQLRQSRGAFVL